MDSYSMLEQLPQTVVEVIAEYCSPQQMAALCAVSSHMRDMFGDNRLWRHHCTKGLAEYLRNTPCKVQPGFVSPESNNSSLSPISRTRLDFMLENHLWNNWRQGKKLSQEIEKESETTNRFSIWDRFYSNDCVMSFMNGPKRLEFIDVRQSPLEDKTVPIPLHGQHDEIYVSNDRACFMKKNCVEVYNLDFENHQNSLEHVFFVDKDVKEQCPLDLSYLSRLSGDKIKSRLVRSLMIAVKDGDATLHIWNIETGSKIKKQDCLLHHAVIQQIKATDKNLILDVTSCRSSNETHSILVYDLDELAYQPFNLTLKEQFNYQAAGQSLAIVSNRLLNVYNFNTSELLLKDINIGQNWTVACLKNGFIFLENHKLKVCNPRARQIVQLPIDDVNSFKILSNRFLQVSSYHRYELGIWEFPSLTKPKKTRMHLGFEVCAFYLNNASTRYIVRYGSHGTLINFW